MEERIVVYRIHLDPSRRELLLAFLSRLPFRGFEEMDSEITAYLEEGTDVPGLERQLAELRKTIPFTYTRQLLEKRNWNALWESNFQPVRVGYFCGVRADFHYPLLDVTHEIIISPRMAFGTGHHETTFLMMQLMEPLDFSAAKVLDYGCGTGILSILAAKMGATMVDAVDVEREAYDNTLENLQVNDVDSVHVVHGTLDSILDSGYRIILANINRNVILSSISALYDKLAQPGILLVSRILREDQPRVVAEAERAGFSLEKTVQKGEWCALKLAK